MLLNQEISQIEHENPHRYGICAAHTSWLTEPTYVALSYTLIWREIGDEYWSQNPTSVIIIISRKGFFHSDDHPVTPTVFPFQYELSEYVVDLNSEPPNSGLAYTLSFRALNFWET